MEIVSNNTAIKWIIVFDLDNAYASMEQSLTPAYHNRALVVTGSNGGNVIARSARAKQLGINMRQPRHEIEHFVRDGSLLVTSANWANYHVLSQRFMRIVQTFFAKIEVYSVDEVFTEAVLTRQEAESLAREVRETVWQWLGLSVSVGIAGTKTLSKLAIDEAKSSPTHIFIIDSAQQLAELLSATLVEDLWNIGAARARRLARIGIVLASQLKDANIGIIRSVLGVVGTRIQAELNGTIAMPMVMVRPPPKNIASQRAFGRPLHTIEELREPVIAYTARLGEKLRAAHMLCETLSVSLATNPFRTDMPQYHRRTTMKLEVPTFDTFVLVNAAMWGLEQVWAPGYSYHRAGVTLSDLLPDTPEQLPLFAPSCDVSSIRAFLHAIDAINRRFGAETISVLGSGLRRERTWVSKSENRSPYYLTRWAEIPTVHIQ